MSRSVLRADAVTSLGNDCRLGMLSPLLTSYLDLSRTNSCEMVSTMSQITHSGPDIESCVLIITEDGELCLVRP
jgi:hypothetical protein